MGILDDAIREHLELKRQHGADNDDLERLEKEAFGPPTRPGDPEFDTSDQPVAAAPEATAASEAETTVQPASSTPEVADTGEGEADPRAGIFDVESGPETKEEDWLASLEDVVDTPELAEEHEVPEPGSLEHPAAPPRDEAEEEGPITGEGDEITPAERARQEHPHLGDTIPHEAVPDPSEQGPETDESEAAPAATEPPEPPESAIFDDEENFDDLDLELDIEEAEGDVEASTSTEMDAIAEPGSTTTSTEMEAVPEPRPAGSTDEFEADDEEEDEFEDEDEDLLNETPDFLQDTPEGDRLWFEQGEPKGFDFEDD